MPALIEFHNATIWRGTTRVFENLNLTIPQHERIAILGPNGCGKTTLLKTINRELYPVIKDDSWVRILGRDRWNVWELRKKIGAVSHDLHNRYTPTTTALAVVVSGFQSSIGIHGLLADRVSAEQVTRAREILATLGMAGLQTVSMQTNNHALLETRAATLAQDIMERIRANPVGDYTIDFAEALAIENVPLCIGIAANCDVDEMAQHDLLEWKCGLGSAANGEACLARQIEGHLPNGDGAIVIDDDVYTVSIRWFDAANNNTRSLSFVTEI